LSERKARFLTFTSGAGAIGLANQGLNRWGMKRLLAVALTTGILDMRADAPTTVWVALESADGSTVYAEQNLSVTSKQLAATQFQT